MTNKTIFSIITATYNNEHNIKRTVESVLRQTINNYEIIIIDNCSNDKTLDIIKEFNSDKIKIFSEPDTGIYNAFNKGIERANGGIIAFLNAGDYYFQNVLALVVEKFRENSSVDCVHGNIRVNGKEVKTPSGIDSLKGSRIFHPATFMKKNVFEKLNGFNEKYKIVSDLDLFIRAKKANFKFLHIDKALTDFELGGKSTKNRAETIKETAIVLKNNSFPYLTGKLFCLSEYIKYFVSR